MAKQPKRDDLEMAELAYAIMIRHACAPWAVDQWLAYCETALQQEQHNART